MTLLACFQPCFTAPSFRTFCALAAGLWPRPGGGRCAACSPTPGCPGCGRMTGRTGFFSHARWKELARLARYRDLDHPAAQGHRTVSTAWAAHRRAGTAPRQGPAAALPECARQHGGLRAGDRVPATARPRPCTPRLSRACGTASSAPGPSRWRWSATARRPATTWPWPPPISPPPQPSSSSGTQAGGARRLRSKT
jgi:hypothetical protein